MGWTSYLAKHYKNGKIDRKVECDELFTQNEHENVNYFKNDGSKIMYPQMRVLKSTMVGSTYYGAIESTYPKSEPDRRAVWCAVVLTQTSNNNEFSYKDMDETCGPYQYECPESILKLLTPTDNVEANKWREACRTYKKQKSNLSNLEIGSIIEFKQEYYNKGKLEPKTVRYYKSKPYAQFKKPFFMNMEEYKYISKNNIPFDYKYIGNFYHSEMTHNEIRDVLLMNAKEKFGKDYEGLAYFDTLNKIIESRELGDKQSLERGMKKLCYAIEFAYKNPKFISQEMKIDVNCNKEKAMKVAEFVNDELSSKEDLYFYKSYKNAIEENLVNQKQNSGLMREKIAENYGINVNSIQGLSQREIEEKLQCEEGELDRFNSDNEVEDDELDL